MANIPFGAIVNARKARQQEAAGIGKSLGGLAGLYEKKQVADESKKKKAQLHGAKTAIRTIFEDKNPENIDKNVNTLSEILAVYPEASEYLDQMWEIRKKDAEMRGGGEKALKKTYSKKNPDGSTRTIKNVRTGSERETKLIDDGFIEGSQTVGAKSTATERKESMIRSNVDNLSEMANKDPNKFFENHKYKQNEDGSLYIHPTTALPIELPPFHKVTGKRGTIKAMQALGEQWDDAKELNELLMLPTVQSNLKKAKDSGLWDKVSGKWSNSIGKWMQGQGIGENSNTATAIARTQKMASDERKRFMGTAVTENEMKSALAWMPNAGDSYETMVNKTDLMGKEAEQAFRRWVEIFEEDADMSPFYKAFGMQRFENNEQLPEGLSEEDVEFNMKTYGVSREEVINKFGAK